MRRGSATKTRVGAYPAYGIAAIRSQFAIARPGSRTPVEGLVLAGASTRTGHGITGAMAGGAEAARVVTGVDIARTRPPARLGGGGVAELLYLDQNYLSGIAKRKPAFRELEVALRGAIARGSVAVAESAVHERESRPRPDLGLLELLRGLSGGRRLPAEVGPAAKEARRRMQATIEREFPQRRRQAGDAADLEALGLALVQCSLVTCDAFMAAVIRRTRLDLRHDVAVYTGRRADVLRLRDRLAELAPP